MKRMLFLFVALGSVLMLHAQKEFSMYDAVIGGYTNLAPERPSQLQWIPATASFAQVKGEGSEAIIEIQTLDASKKGMETSISMSELNNALWKSFPSDTLKRMPGIRFVNDHSLRFYHNKKMLLYNQKEGNMRQLIGYDPATDEHAAFTEDYSALVYVHQDNLYLRNASGEKQITEDGGKGLVYGQSVHRNEFGIDGGLFWSPDLSKIAFYRMDERMVTEYPVYNLKSSPATADMIRYPVAGAPSHHVTLGVYDLKTGKTTYLKTGEPAEQYLTNITWGPNSNDLYIAIVNREQNHMWLKSFSAQDGSEIRTLFEEKHPKYVEPEHGPLFLNKQKEQFIWQSERDGYNQLYLYDVQGSLIRQLTKGNEPVTRVIGIDPQDDCVLYEAATELGTSRTGRVVKIKNGRVHDIDVTPGMHSLTPNSEFTHVIDAWHNPEVPYRVDVRKIDGKMYSMLHLAENPLKEYALGATQTGILKSFDGSTDLVYRVVKPTNFDPSKKYPVVVYLYNGPHLQLVNNGWLHGANLWYHYMVQKGVVMFSIDGRGSADRGLEFENAIHRQLGTLEMEDQLAGVQWLKQQPWVDSTRLGVHGWSYGGFMTTSLMTRKAGTFKVGVAGGPVIDWKLYEIMYTERYMDTPEENPEGYAANNLLKHIDKLQDKLLVIHGAEDDVVLWQHSLLLLEEAIKKGVQLDYFVYPHHQHNVRGKDRVHLMQKISDYLIEGLK